MKQTPGVFVVSRRSGLTEEAEKRGVKVFMAQASQTHAIKDKVHEFRERAVKAKLKAAATSEKVAKKIFQDAAQQFDDMADKLEKHGRPY